MFLYSGSLEEHLSEVDSAVQNVQENSLEQLAEEAAPVVEQETDLSAANDIMYDIDVEPGFESFYESGSKNYYEAMMGEDDDSYRGASFSSTMETYEHDMLQDAQNLATDIREAQVTNSSHSDSFIDMNVKDKKWEMKMYSDILWKVMYDGKLVFN